MDFGGYAGDLRAARDAADGHFGSPGKPKSGVIGFFLFLHNASLVVLFVGKIIGIDFFNLIINYFRNTNIILNHKLRKHFSIN